MFLNPGQKQVVDVTFAPVDDKPVSTLIIIRYNSQIKSVAHYFRCITPKRVMSLRSLSPHHCVCVQHSFKVMLQRFRVVGNTVPDLTGPGFELQTPRFRDERVTAGPTGRYGCQFNYPFQSTSWRALSIFVRNRTLKGAERLMLHCSRRIEP